MKSKSSLFFLLIGLLILAGVMLFKTHGQIRSSEEESAEANQPSQEERKPTQTETKRIDDSIPKSQTKPDQKNLDSATETKKVDLLREILASKNDNDPRIDTDLAKLTEQEKRRFQNIYNDLKKESLNERGTVVFLVGRNIASSEDLYFLKSVLQEAPCANLNNCSGPQNGMARESHSSVNDLTLAYPQVMALHSIKTFLISPELDVPLKQLALDILSQAATLPSEMVQGFAKKTLQEVKQIQD